MSNYIIETRGLTKKYGEQTSVSKLSLHVRKGRIYGLLGRNGAGKTTTMRMLLGLTEPTSGDVKIFGKPLRGNEKKILPRKNRAGSFFNLCISSVYPNPFLPADKNSRENKAAFIIYHFLPQQAEHNWQEDGRQVVHDLELG